MNKDTYNFEISNNSADELTIGNILKRVSEVVLWRYYIGSSFRLDKTFSAPYRPDDKASFSLKYDYRGRLMFKDFGRPGMYGDIFNYLQKVYNISFIESLERVNEDFKLGLINQTIYVIAKGNTKSNNKEISKEEVEKLLKFEKKFKETQSQILIQAVTRKWEEEDLAYWKKFGISKETLDKYFVFPANKVFKNKQLIYTYNPNNPCYVYYFPKSKHVKCYLPLSLDKSKRFFGNVNNLEDIQGYYQCDIKNGDRENKLLILTKSMKDVMLLREFGYDAVALHGESHRFEDDFIRHIKKYYGKIVSLYDRDKAGILGAKRLWKEHNIKAFFIQKKWYCKDISDMFMTYERNIVEDFLVNLKNRT